MRDEIHSKISAMTEDVFSHFLFRTGAYENRSTHPSHFLLQPADVDNGRFWLGLICALRQRIPGVGQAVLASLVDHHSQVNVSALDKLATELTGWEGNMIIENSRFVTTAPWWPLFESWQSSLSRPEHIVISPSGENLVDHNPGSQIPSAISQNLSQLPLDVQGMFAVSEAWWLDWFLENNGLQGYTEIIDILKENGLIEILERWHLAIPSWNIQQAFIHNLRTNDYEQVAIKIREMQAWLEQCGQWLQCVRFDLLLKDYEKAALRLEDHSDWWSRRAGEVGAMEQLFWLRELPTVILPTKPLLCLQAASAAHQLGLGMQVSYYCNLASQHLYSLRRLARNEHEWLAMQVNEAGATIASLIEKIEILKRGSQDGAEIFKGRQ